MKFRLAAVLAVLTGLPALATSSFTYEGYLEDSSGPVSGNVNIEFSILAMPANCVLYRETQSVNVETGSFRALVGYGTSPTGLSFAQIFSSAPMSFDSCVFDPMAAGSYRALNVVVDSIDLGNVVLTEAPRALVAETAERIAGRGVETTAPSNGQVLRWDQSLSLWRPSAETAPSWAGLSGKPSSLAGYGISDAVANRGSVPSLQSGSDSSRPAAGEEGRIYFAVDSQKIYRDSGTSWDLIASATAASGGSGSVTSVGLSVPPYMTSSGGPVTTAGSLQLDFASQAAARVFASPVSGSGSPSFRSLQVSDLKSSFGGNFFSSSSCLTGEALVYLSASDTVSCQPLSLGVNQISNGSGLYLAYRPNGTACVNGQLLKWQNSRWECGNDADTAAAGLSATQLTSGILSAARLPALIGDVTSSAASNTLSVVRIQGQPVAATAPAANQVLKWVGGAWTPSADLSSGGTVTKVTGAEPITVTNGTSTPAISLATGGVTGTHLLDGTVATADLADGAVTNGKITSVVASKISSAAGLYLTYAPNNVACAAGQVLKWTNSRWECGADLGTVVANGSATGQMLRWTGSAWAPSADGSSLTGLNATQLTTGSLPTARLPALGGDVTSTAGTNSLSVVKLRGNAVAAGTPTLNQVLKWNGSAWAPGTDADSGGLLTSITAGSGLSGGTITTSGTIAIASGGVTETLLGANAVTTAKIKDSNVTDAKIAGVSVSKISSGSGLYLTYRPNGSACANGQVLMWNSTLSRWDCGTVAGSIATVSGSAPVAITNSGGNVSVSLQNSGVSAGTYRSVTVNEKGIVTAASNPTSLGAYGVSLANASIFVGNASAVPTAVSLSGDATLSNTGALTVTRIQGRTVASTAPASGQVLKWNGSAWAPAADNSSGGGGISACPTGMKVVAASTSSSAFCISSSELFPVAGSLNMRVMQQTCATQGGQLCELADLISACEAGALPTTGDRWTGMPGDDAGEFLRYNCSGTVFSSPASMISTSGPYRCCRR